MKRVVDICVEPDSNSDNGYRFWMEEDKVKKDAIIFNKTKSKIKKSEDYEVELQLKNQNGANLRFSKDKSMVFWAQVVTGAPPYPCPPPQSTCSEVYVDPTAFIKDDLLKVINTDMTSQEISFALNFLEPGQEDGPGTQYVRYDPIFSNQNGGASRNSMSSTATYAAIGGAIVVGAAALYACGAFRS